MIEILKYREHWGDPCPTCIELYMGNRMRGEAVRPLIDLPAMNPLSRYESSGRHARTICHDCAAAEGLMARATGLDFYMARTAVANDRQEVMRLPGLPRASDIAASPGELEAIHEWLAEYKISWLMRHQAKQEDDG